MKMRDLVWRAFGSGAIMAMVLTVQADVFTDCTAWYIGGSGTVGAFVNGDMTDIRHTAIADSPTHGGAMRGNANGVSNLCETVYSAASGRTFENQRTIYMAQAPGVTSKGLPGFRENGVALPFAATNENYTLLLRMKLDDTQPTNKVWVYIADFGYQGGSDTASRYSFGFRYNWQTEQIGVLYNNGSGNTSISVTNNVCPTLRGKWLEFSIAFEKLTSGKDRMRFGVGGEGVARTYGYVDYQFPAGQSLPVKQKLYLGGTTGYGGVSASCSAARGSYHLISYWERVLTDDEILEAFKRQGPDGTTEQEPALLKVGDPAWSEDVFGGTIEGSRAMPSLDFQDLGKIPLQLAAGQTLNLPFTVPATCTNLRQIVRLTAASGSAAANIQVRIDDQAVGVADAVAGKTACVTADAALFTEGPHTLSLTRTDSGAGALKLASVEISGSWRLGWIDDAYKPFQSDTASTKTVLTNAVANLTTNIWPLTRGTVKTTRRSALSACLAAEDVATRRFYLRAQPYEMPGAVFDCVVLANGVEVFRRKVDGDDPKRFERIDLSFPPETLKAGENVFTFLTDNLTSGTASWLRFDYFELEVGTEPTGGLFFLK